MSSSSAIRAGRAYVEMYLEDGKLERGLRKAQQRIAGFGSAMRRIGAGLMGFGAGILAPLAATIHVASALEETMNKFDVVFGNNAEAAKAWADSFAADVGRSKQQVADFLSGTQDLLVPIGFEAGAAEKMSKDLTGLAVDLASFNNKADSDVLRDLHAALTGSGEVMKKYGVIVSEAAVKLRLLNEGIDPKAASEQEKVMARWSIILEGTTAAQGDAMRSAGSFANQMKALRGRIADTAAEIGSTLLPVVTPLVTQAADAVQSFAKWASENKELFITLGKVGAATVAAGVALVGIGTVLGALSSIMGVATTATVALNVAMTFLAANPVVLAFAAIATTAVAAGVAIYYLTDATAELANEMQSAREEGDKMRETDAALIDRLVELADKQRMSTDEMKEAHSIINTLRDQYGNLGISIDETTGKIDGMTGAQGRLNDAMRAAAEMQLADELEEQRRNIQALKDEQESLQGVRGVLATVAGYAAPVAAVVAAGPDLVPDMVDEVGHKIKTATIEANVLQARLDALRAGDSAAITGVLPEEATDTETGQGTDPATGQAAATAAAGNASDEERWARRAEQLRLQAIEERGFREKGLIDERYKHEIAKAKEAGASAKQLADIEKARSLEFQASDKAAFEDSQAVKARAVKDAQAVKARAVEDAERKRVAIINQRADLDDDIARIKIDMSDMTDAEKQIAHLTRDRDQGFAGTTDVAVRGKIEERLNLQIEQIQAGSNEAFKRADPSAGTFSATEAGRGMGGGSAMDRVADNTKRMVAGIDTLNRTARRSKLVFG